MEIINIISILLFLLLSTKINSQEKEKIIFAWEMNRHGARAPYLGVVNGIDAYGEKWIQIEELSEVGKRMLYLLGVSLRKRYIEEYKLIKETFDPKEIYIRSSDVNRTIESMESLLQGFFPNGTGKKLKSEIYNDKTRSFPPNKNYSVNFDEIINKYNLNEEGASLPYQMSMEPIHLFYKQGREFYLYDKSYCPCFQKSYAEISSGKIVQDFVNDKVMPKFGEMFKGLEGTDNDTFLYDYSILYKYMDGFICDDIDVRNFYDLKQKYPIMQSEESLKEMRQICLDYLWMDYKDINYATHGPAITGMSYTMHSILNWMKNAKEAKDENYIKLVFYSAHDATIGALEDFMKMTFETEIEYATFAEVRLFELYVNNTNGEDKYFVRYVKGVKDKDYEYKLDVPFDEFVEKVNEAAWSDERVADFCQFPAEKQTVVTEDGDNSISKWVMIGLIALNVILLSGLIYVFILEKD